MRALRLMVLCLVVLAWPASASAEVTVLVTARAPARPAPGLVESLRIQLAKAATLRLGPPLNGSSLTDRQEQARTLRAQQGAVLVVWIEPEGTAPETPAALRLTIVSARAEVDWRRLKAPGGPATDRAVALLVREALDQALAARSTRDGDGGGSRPARPEPAAEPAPSPWAFVLDVGAVAAAGSVTADAQAGGLLSLGGRFHAGSLLSELVVGASLVTAMDTEQPAGTLDIGEIGVGVGLRALYATTHLAIGGFVEPSLRLLDAEGRTPQGATGNSFRVVPALLCGPELRWLIHDNLHLRGAAGAQFALRRQRFSISDQVLIDVGTARAVAQLGLVGSLP